MLLSTLAYTLPLIDYTEQPPILLEHKNNYIRVVATELHPRIQYKTLPITEYTTAYEVVVKLVTKFATKEEDKDPDLFYLNEASGQGCNSLT